MHVATSLCIFTFALHFGDIFKGDSENIEVIFK
jgi:hypothetical protein